MNEFQIKYFIVSRNVDLISTHTGLKQLQIYNFRSGSWNYKNLDMEHDMKYIPYSTHRNVKLVSHFLPQTYDGEHLILRNTLRTCPTNQYIYNSQEYIMVEFLVVIWTNFSIIFFVIMCVNLNLCWMLFAI
jgi:hypothetical protein